MCETLWSNLAEGDWWVRLDTKLILSTHTSLGVGVGEGGRILGK